MCEKLLCVKVDVNFSFDNYISDLCKKASKKMSALARFTPFMKLGKRKLLINAFFTSKFSNCPLIWMCHSRTNNIKTNMLHERCLRIIWDKVFKIGNGNMVCLSRSYHFKFFKDCLPQILLGPPLNTLSHL